MIVTPQMQREAIEAFQATLDGPGVLKGAYKRLLSGHMSTIAYYAYELGRESGKQTELRYAGRESGKQAAGQAHDRLMRTMERIVEDDSDVL